MFGNGWTLVSHPETSDVRQAARKGPVQRQPLHLDGREPAGLLTHRVQHLLRSDLQQLLSVLLVDQPEGDLALGLPEEGRSGHQAAQAGQGRNLVLLARGDVRSEYRLTTVRPSLTVASCSRAASVAGSRASAPLGSAVEGLHLDHGHIHRPAVGCDVGHRVTGSLAQDGRTQR